MTDFDYDLAHELKLHADNLTVHFNSVGKTLSKFWLKGCFDYERASGYIYRNLTTPAAKDYHSLCGSLTQSWFGMFPIPERKYVTEKILMEFLDEFHSGNFWE